jgi:aminopeptidase N
MRFAVALFLVLGAAFARSQEVPEYRLPTTFKPISYRLDVTTHLENKFTFEGVVDIKVSVRRLTFEHRVLTYGLIVFFSR